MTEKERLEVIRNRMIVEKHHFKYLNSEKGYRENVYTLLEQDVQYLFEQAERVQELEKSLEHGAKVAVKTAEKLYQEHQQNKCYRDALEFYSNEDNYEHETIVTDCDIGVESKILEDSGVIARKALWCIHCNGKGFNGLDYCPHCNYTEKSD